MSESIDPRLDDAPSERVVDAYVLDEAEPDEVAEVEAWLARDPGNQAVIDARRAGFESFPDARPQVMLARIRLGLEEAAAEEARSRQPARRAGLPRWWVFGLGFAAAAAATFALLVLGPGENGIAPPEDTVMAKGDIKLRIFRARGEVVDELVSPARVEAGDRLRFQLDDLPTDTGRLMVVGVESNGTVFPYHPADGAAIPSTGAADAEGALPGSAVLDDSVGKERVWLVWCPDAFDTTHLKPDAGALVVPAGCRTAGFTLDKR